MSLKSEPYRLGDYVRRAGGFSSRWYYFTYRYSQPHNSIIRRYGNRTSKAENVAVLADIVRQCDAPRTPDAALIIHLRLGDVIDNHDRSVDSFLSGDYQVNDEMWDSMNGRKWRGTNCTAQTCTSEGYVKPLTYFETLLSKVPVCVRRVILVSGSHTQTKNPQKSAEYLRRLREFLEQYGFEVEVRWNKPPDDDFVFMSNAKYFVPSGGGFSELVARVVKEFGGLVLT